MLNRSRNNRVNLRRGFDHSNNPLDEEFDPPFDQTNDESSQSSRLDEDDRGSNHTLVGRRLFEEDIDSVIIPSTSSRVCPSTNVITPSERGGQSFVSNRYELPPNEDRMTRVSRANSNGREEQDPNDPDFGGISEAETPIDSTDESLAYLNLLDPLLASNWKDKTDKTIKIETCIADRDMKMSLLNEAEMIRKKVRTVLKLNECQTPSLKELFQVFFGVESVFTKVLMRYLELDYVNFLIFLNTICTLIIFRMSLKSYENLNVLMNPVLSVIIFLILLLDLKQTLILYCSRT